MDKNVNNHSGFDIDEILEEARRIKLQRLKQDNFSDTGKKDTEGVKLSDLASKDEESEQTPAEDGGQSEASPDQLPQGLFPCPFRMKK